VTISQPGAEAPGYFQLSLRDRRSARRHLGIPLTVLPQTDKVLR